MFVGHFAVALVAKRATPRLSLPLLFAAVQFLDILWPVFILLGIEHARIVPGLMQASPLDLYDMPYSHSLATSILWSVLFALPLLVVRRVREGLVLAFCVFSHFILDFVTHRPDLPLAPGSARRFGLGLWNFRTAEVAVEALLFAAGIAVYVRGTTATKRMGSIGFGIFMAVLAAIWLGGAYGPAPPDIKVVAWSLVVSMPIILLTAWAVDHARRPIAAG
jgi:hypothetical protein